MELIREIEQSGARRRQSGRRLSIHFQHLKVANEALSEFSSRWTCAFEKWVFRLFLLCCRRRSHFSLWFLFSFEPPPTSLISCLFFISLFSAQQLQRFIAPLACAVSIEALPEFVGRRRQCPQKSTIFLQGEFLLRFTLRSPTWINYQHNDEESATNIN